MYNIRDFKRRFEELGYTFQSEDVLEDVYTFYKYYKHETNEGVAAMLLEGDPGCGKSYMSKIFAKFLGEDSVYIYTGCVDETNSDKLVNTYNVPAIVKSDADNSIADGIILQAIKAANEGKKVVLAIDELDKAREALDSHFLNFLQDARLEKGDNKVVSLTEEGRKNLYVIFAKNNERDLLNALLRRCEAVIKLPSMPPVLAYKTLLKKFDGASHDPKFLKFICKVYEAVYNEQMDSNEELLERLPALQELATAITSDYLLYEDGISSTRRIRNLIRKLGKDDATRDVITNILINKFKYQNKESNYTNETLDLDMSDPDDYMNQKDADSLVEQYIAKKDSGEDIFDEDEVDDPMTEIANILDTMKEDKTLVFLSKENKEKIVELGVITHQNPNAIKTLFNRVRFKGNPNSRFGFLSFEDENFIGLMKYQNSLILIANKEYVSPRLFIRGLSDIVRIIYDHDENPSMNEFYFSPMEASNFKLTSLNAKILSHVPDFVLNKMQSHQGKYVYQEPNLKVTYNEDLNVNYFRYLQKYKAEPLYDVVEKICRFNPELAIPSSFINGKMFSTFNSDLVRKKSKLDYYRERKEDFSGNTYDIADFPTMKITVREPNPDYKGYAWDDEPSTILKEDDYVFEWKEIKDVENKMVHIYPKYEKKDGYILYTDEEDFMKDNSVQYMDPFQKEIAILAKDIFGKYIPIFAEGKTEYFSALTMSQTARIMENPNNRRRIPGINYDITEHESFKKYYDSLSSPAAVVTPNKVFKKVK